MSKVSKMVADRAAIARAVQSAATVHGPEAAADLEALLFPSGAPEKVTVADFLAALGDTLGRYVVSLEGADRAHAAELSDDDGYRTARDERMADLKNVYASLRELVVRSYGPAVADAYGLGSALPEDPQLLLSLAGHAEKLLRERPLTEQPKIKSLTLAPIAAAEDLAFAMSALRSALNDVEREKREAQLTQNAKDELMARWGSVYPGVADALAGLFTLAKRPALADRVRPTARRRAGLPEVEDTAPAQPSAETGKA
ncbi:hypothetical protein [Polyangium sorediatum]|uniref:Uncharacterized protein n=1 Tax=Polyangium sorediatum TaxID=889274 RepID=A0ABT6P0W7_9BACT|nr:hypothetical protein [Polyangium sorediatum]MDI1434256.1 hypothetical protein [Polyangium sorediatum]